MQSWRWLPLLLLMTPTSLAQTIQTRTQGALRAELSYTLPADKSFLDITHVRMKIQRAGKIIYDAPVPEDQGVPLVNENPAAFQIRDLDRDGSPEVWADFYSGGAHCCTESVVYYGAGDRLRTVTHLWGNQEYELQKDGTLLSADDRFAYGFSSFADSLFPPQVWRYQAGKFNDVTRQYPALIRAEAKEHLQRYREAQRTQSGVVSALAAYVADQFLLGQGKQAWVNMTRSYRGPSCDDLSFTLADQFTTLPEQNCATPVNRKKVLAKVWAFLKTSGYR